MSTFRAVDVALGLILLYFLLSVICSAINEMIASGLGWRARDLERGILQLLGDHEAVFRKHPLIESLVDPARRDRVKARGAPLPGWRVDRRMRRWLTRKVPAYPNYIPSRTFVAALLGHYDNPESRIATARDIEQSIAKIQNENVKRAMLALFHHAQRDAVEFRRAAERWYDDTMERVSGWYRRRIQKVLFVLAAMTTLLINADTLQIAKYLWTNPAAQQAVANAAGRATGDEGGRDAVQELNDLPLPLGWHYADRKPNPQGIPFYERGTSAWDVASKLVGLLLTTFALLLGAPFWFDTLSKIARLRNSGAPPPASDAVRHGEGEETRRGTTTFVMQPPEVAGAGPATKGGPPEPKGT